MLRKFFLAPLLLFAAAALLVAPASASLLAAPAHTEKIDFTKAVPAYPSVRCEAKRSVVPTVLVTRNGTTARSPDQTGKLVASIAASYLNSRAMKVPWCNT